MEDSTRDAVTDSYSIADLRNPFNSLEIYVFTTATAVIAIGVGGYLMPDLLQDPVTFMHVDIAHEWQHTTCKENPCLPSMYCSSVSLYALSSFNRWMNKEKTIT